MKKVVIDFNNTKQKKIIMYFVVLTVVITTCVGIYTLTKENLPNFILKNNKAIELEYGEKYSVNGMNLLNTKGLDEEDIKVIKKGIKIKSDFKYEENKEFPSVGEYIILLTFNDKTLVKKVKVKDTIAPEINTEYSSIDIVKGTDLTNYDFASLFSADDLSPIELNFDLSMIDTSAINSYVLRAVAKDSSDNVTSKDVTINVTECPNENQKLVTEVVINDDGSKSIKNTLKEINKGSTHSKNLNENNPSKNLGGSDNKNSISSNTNNGSTSNGIKQSFVANMSISNQTTQAITVIGNGGSYATLTLHTKQNGIWTETLSCSARVGKNGITSNKKEGDGKTPTGIYSFGQAFGVANNPGISRNWLTVNSNHYWVDDASSPFYNRLVDASQTGIQWSSAEHLIDYPTAYKYAIAVNYNTAYIPNAGSAIFLHCSTGGSTAGCISISQSNMIHILQFLQADALIGIYQNSNNVK